MGIPAFYRWLVEKYPRTVVDAVEESPAIVDGVAVPVDASRPNPNGVEYDNLYLDMNGIIHPCFHPEGLPSPKTYVEVFHAVFKYIDRIFSIIRPRKLLFLAIDGVAPRAKMNQQRARRFRAAKEVADEVSARERLQGGYESEPEELSEKKLDSNVITPGTEFMEMLSSALRYYIHLRMNKNPGWQGIKVILSDASVPGEGEHKIVSYIRLQRNLPGYDPNTRHCLYGLDADLIMLALATHEVHFTILREDVRRALAKDRNPKQRINGSAESKQGESFVSVFDSFLSGLKFQILRIWILREYLAHELQIQDPTVQVDWERLIDDFVFMCLFVGNDFLPHVPSLEIREGAIDLLMIVYKKEFVRMGGYLTKSFEVNLERVEHFIKAVGSHETAIFRRRSQFQKEGKTRKRHSSAKSSRRKAQAISNHVEVNSAVDKVKMDEKGWKERYYAEKFEVQTDDERDRIRKQVVSEYVEGICWVMHYYYQGICSWQWYYPYHYAPFASDFQGLDQLEISFTLGKPFKPFDQLMGVLPAASAQALPFFYRELMTDPSSPILDFYPTDFEVDLNGKKHVWQGVCKLPFIEEGRLLAEITKVEHTLTDGEKQRNRLGLDVLFVYKSHPLAPRIRSFDKRNKDNPKLPKAKIKRKIKPEFSGGMNGYMYISSKPVCPPQICSPIDEMDTMMKNKVISVFYKVPSFHPHIPKLLEGVIMPEKCISHHDICPTVIPWHEKTAINRNRYSARPIPRKAVSGPYLAKLAHKLVSQTCVVKSQTSRIQFGNGERKLDGAAEKTKKKKRRNKRRKLNAAMNEVASEAMDEATKEAANKGTNEATTGENQCENEMKKSDGSEEKTKKKRRNKKRKLNEAMNEVAMNEAINKGPNEALIEATSEAPNEATNATNSENQCENGNGKKDGAEETAKKKKQRNKKRKLNEAMNEVRSEAMDDAAEEAANKGTNEATNDTMNTGKMNDATNKAPDEAMDKAMNEGTGKVTNEATDRVMDELAKIEAMNKGRNEALIEATSVAETTSATNSENQRENGNGKRDGADETTKKKRRNKKRKMNNAMNEVTSEGMGDAAKEAANKGSEATNDTTDEAKMNEATDKASNEATDKVMNEGTGKATIEAMDKVTDEVAKNEAMNKVLNESLIEATSVAPNEATHAMNSENGNGKRNGADETTKKKKQRNKKRKMSEAVNEVTSEAMYDAKKEVSNKGTDEATNDTTNEGKTNEATDKAMVEVTGMTMNDATGMTPNDATGKATNDGMGKATNDAMDKATSEATNCATSEATNCATNEATNDAMSERKMNKATEKATKEATIKVLYKGTSEAINDTMNEGKMNEATGKATNEATNDAMSERKMNKATEKATKEATIKVLYKGTSEAINDTMNEGKLNKATDEATNDAMGKAMSEATNDAMNEGKLNKATDEATNEATNDAMNEGKVNEATEKATSEATVKVLCKATYEAMTEATSEAMNKA